MQLEAILDAAILLAAESFPSRAKTGDQARLGLDVISSVLRLTSFYLPEGLHFDSVVQGWMGWGQNQLVMRWRRRSKEHAVGGGGAWGRSRFKRAATSARS